MPCFNGITLYDTILCPFVNDKRVIGAFLYRVLARIFARKRLCPGHIALYVCLSHFIRAHAFHAQRQKKPADHLPRDFAVAQRKFLTLAYLKFIVPQPHHAPDAFPARAL